ncbi:MAG TPA: hemerythrin domain-containing protein, partial [Mariprofundaceae bacterium]|nr:hemerythrin domain-containing protein [Mariprofundaceae bacterium]
MAAAPWKIEWSDALSMNNTEIDAEHKTFISLVNELNSAIISRQRKADVESILKRIVDHSILHFSNEERLFVQMQYPKTQEHMQLHASLIITLKKMMVRIHNTEFGREWTEIGFAIKNALV